MTDLYWEIESGGMARYVSISHWGLIATMRSCGPWLLPNYFLGARHD